jgi:hypothetical protein
MTCSGDISRPTVGDRLTVIPRDTSVRLLQAVGIAWNNPLQYLHSLWSLKFVSIEPLKLGNNADMLQPTSYNVACSGNNICRTTQVVQVMSANTGTLAISKTAAGTR